MSIPKINNGMLFSIAIKINGDNAETIKNANRYSFKMIEADIYIKIKIINTLGDKTRFPIK
ncbi:MAG: hypothetical protein WCQ54_11165 [Clostridiaceae bacterium]